MTATPETRRVAAVDAEQRSKHGYGTESDCICGRNFGKVRGLREHLTKARRAEAKR